MALNRYFNTSFWKDNYIVDLDPTEKLLFNYLFTNAKVNISGVYEIHLKEIGFDIGIDKDMVAKIIKRFEDDGKLLYHEGWVILVNALKHQKLNPNIIIGIKAQYEALPTDIRTMTLSIWSKQNYGEKLSWLPASDTKEAKDVVKEAVEPLENAVEVLKKGAQPLDPLLLHLNQKLGGGANIKITDGRKSKLRSRLKTFSVDELVEAAEVIGADEFLQGKNDRNTKYANIDFLIRSDDQVAKYLERGKPEATKKKRNIF